MNGLFLFSASKVLKKLYIQSQFTAVGQRDTVLEKAFLVLMLGAVNLFNIRKGLRATYMNLTEEMLRTHNNSCLLDVVQVESLRAQVAQKDMFISELLDRIAIVECEVGGDYAVCSLCVF